MASLVKFIIFLIAISTSISAINAAITSKTFKFSSASTSTSTSLSNVISQLKKSGYKSLAYVLQLNYHALANLKNMTIFAIDDFSIIVNKADNDYFDNVQFHIIPNRYLMLSDLEKLPQFSALPTLIRGEYLFITTPGVHGGDGDYSPMQSLRINYVPIEYHDLMYNSEVVVHGIAFPFGHISIVLRSFCSTLNDDYCDTFEYVDDSHDEL